MAITYVGGTTGTGTSNGYTISLSGTLTGGSNSSPSAGDVVVVFSGFGNTASSAPAVSGNTSGAYIGATAAQHVNDTWDTEFRSFYQKMGVTPDTTLTITRATNTAYGGATTVQVWRGVDPTTPLIGAATPASGGNGAALNPPAYNPAVADAMIIAGGAGTFATADTAGYTGISGMSNAVIAYGNGSTADISVIMASFAYAGSSYDPATATGGNQANASSSWAGVTLALRAEITVVNATVTPGVGSASIAGAAVTWSGGASASPTTGDASYAGLALENAGPLPLGSYSAGTYGTGAYNASTVSQTVTPGAGAVTVAGLAATFAAGFTATPAQGTVAVTGLAPTVAGSAVAASSLGTVAILGRAATLAASSTAATGVGAVTVTGAIPTVTGSVSASPTTATVTATGLAPSVVAGASITTSLGAVTVDGFAPDVVSGGGTLTLETFAGEISLAGYEVTLTGVWVSESSQSELWTEQAEQSETWTPQGNQSEAWAGQSAQSETWTPQSADPWS